MEVKEITDLEFHNMASSTPPDGFVNLADFAQAQPETIPQINLSNVFEEQDIATNEIRPFEMLSIISLSGLILVGSMLSMARGGNFKNVRINLMAQGKANAKEPMPKIQKIIRRRKKKS